MEKNKIKKYIWLFFLIPFLSFGQKVELIMNRYGDEYQKTLIMSQPYYKEDNSNSKVIFSTDSFLFSSGSYSLNAIDWIYNTKNELWLEVECWDWSTAECCDCSETKIAVGWIHKENITGPSLFSKILKPFSLDIINELKVDQQMYGLNLKSTNKRQIEIDMGWMIEGYGGVLFIYDYSVGWINLKGELTRLTLISEPKYPDRRNLEFAHYYLYKSDDIELRIYSNNMDKYMEIYYQEKMERILLTQSEWMHPEEYNLDGY